MESYFAYTGLLGIIITVICIGISWWGLQAIRIDIFTYHPKSAQTKVLQIILSIVIGYLLAQFFIDYLGWSYNLRNFF